MFQQAQDMMRNMSPEQMANMQRMVSNMTPEQRENMQRMAANMGMSGAPSGMPSSSGHATYEINAARMLKDEGNSLHKQGSHAAAIAKYDRALSNLTAYSTPEAMDLKTSCELNKAMCHLKLEQWQSCEAICSTVLSRTFPLLFPLLALAFPDFSSGDYRFTSFTPYSASNGHFCLYPSGVSLPSGDFVCVD
jgi:hypothetical protein